MNAMVVSATPKQLDSVGAWHTMIPSSVAASVSMSSTPTVYFATMRSRCEGLYDPPADRSVAHRRTHERNRAARCLDHRIFMLAAGQLPGAVAEHELAAQSFKRVDGLGRLFARGKDENFRLGHAGSVARGPNSA
jgi:hypothetical protein